MIACKGIGRDHAKFMPGTSFHSWSSSQWSVKSSRRGFIVIYVLFFQQLCGIGCCPRSS
jgi:hypothetical protein